MAAQPPTGIRLSALCPKFLHTNSTSHTWPFSAVAELIDNAYDPDVNAKQIWIDKTVISDHICLTFTDNGNGMTADKLHKMLSFGFSDKVTMNGHVPVGLYGNGFKSGSMRLGKDAMVFTKNGETMSVGFLSQTYLEVIKAEHVVVPIVTFNKHRQMINLTESKASLAAILEHSLFSTEQKLLAELNAIMGKKGTRIIIWNLRSYKNATEFDFEKDKYDIRIPEDLDETAGRKGYKKQERMDQIAPESDYSLRAYCSILYLKPRMQIIIRGQKVKTQLVSKSLAYIERDVYRPKFLTRTVRITFGFNCRNKDHYGIMMYHKNRLIKAYEKVGCQLKANNMGVGVVGIIECNFLKPTHNKQDFDYTNEYRLTILALGEKLNDYWNEMKVKKNAEYPVNLPVEDIQKRPDQTWVQCDACLKWRKLPDGIDQLPEKWYCSNNPDPQFRNCEVPEEPEDEDLVHPTYEKTYKKTSKERFRIRQPEILPRILPQINPELLYQTSVSSQSFSPVKESVPRPHLSEVTSPFAARIINLNLASPASEPENSSMKRKLGVHSSILNAKTRRLSNPPVENSSYKNDDDEDVIILEENSTPKPAVDLEVKSDIEVKSEQSHTEQSGIHVDLVSSPKPCVQASSTSTSTSRSDPGITVSTQTDAPGLTVKKEESMEEDMGVRNGTATLSCVGTEAKVQETSAESVDATSHQLQELRSELLVVTQERDDYKRQCQMFTDQIQVLQQRLLEMNDKCVKKEKCHQSTETDAVFLLDSVNGQAESLDHLGSQYQQALQEIERLKRQCSALQQVKSECSQASCTESKSEVDEMAVQLDDVFRQLDKCTIERDQYKNEVQLLEIEKSHIHSQCEELQTEVEQLKSTGQQAAADGSTASNAEEPVSYVDGESLKLRSLRVNVGQLLAMIVPDLDLQQVNYDVDVVDEILGQVVEQMSEISST
ncbi:MORC family CW-type zinc finger protein 3 [Mus musculus]|uniref:MORC family CW-type zinc finger protein 3 n=1 Tax=Mus musculus TaxID=10090 RepID=MORC3_MOUSE|nr:MORC family CW-type zinc finger protein 3 [Mus musculus]F7BJB9.1 RecName: Full=MORC family CW-type zinc finger protein 3; AltName: Full=Nuclear matrix protein 2; AltName: Full=Zinc finger CW-type coiled-coil domain protein 3 [Mus musculus]|eukprot:NP_001038994.2 MORC family CW-type zinc finger protein 3 [Mus musculus]